MSRSTMQRATDAADRLWSGTRIASLAGVGLLALGAWMVFHLGTPQVDRAPVRSLILDLPSGLVLATAGDRPPPVAISEDGSQVAVAARGETGVRILVRRLDQPNVEAVTGTEGGSGPFFSPDGKWLGFFADGKLKKVPLSGGRPIAIAEATRGWGGAWGADGTILYSPAIGSGLWSIPAAGGEAVRLTVPDLDRGERQHDSPRWLPGGESALFNIWTGGSYSQGQIGILYLESGSWRSLVVGGSDAFFAAPGYLVWSVSGALMAQPFDPRTREFSGRGGQVVDSLLSTAGVGAGIFAVSASGTLVYARGPEAETIDELVTVVNWTAALQQAQETDREAGR